MLKVRTFSKQLVFLLLHLSRLDRFCWFKSSNHPLILFAHRVGNISSLGLVGDFFKGIQPQLIDNREFLNRLKLIQKFYRFVSLDEAIENTFINSTNKYAVMTLDDTYVDFIQVVQPLLQEMGIPVLFYITTSALEQDELLWFDKVYSAIIGTEQKSVKIKGLGEIRFSFKNIKSKRSSAIAICKLLWNTNILKRKEVITELVDKIGMGPLSPKYLYLSKKDLFNLAKKPDVTIGSHTVTHPNLIQITNEEVEYELSESKAVLESLVGYKIKHLSYPNGFADERIWKIAQRNNYEYACMTAKGNPANRYGLHRANIGWGRFHEFSVRVSGLWPW